jgi:hypothetical protein
MNALWIRGKHTVGSIEISDAELTRQQQSGEIDAQCGCGDYLSESFAIEFGSMCPKCRPVEDKVTEV